MTALVLDLGNTRWKLARTSGGDVGEVSGGDYDAQDALAAALAAHRDRIDAILVASVVDPQTTAGVVDAAKRIIGRPVRQVASTDPMPNLIAGYQRPEQLGADRLLAMVAARAFTQQCLCVIDAGTAVTIDFVDSTGQHLGGFILPGQRMARECLLANTAIPRDDKVDERAVLGRDTATAVALGTRHAVVGIAERFTSGRAALFDGQTVHTVIGGGDAERLLGLLPDPCSKLDHLVLRGLAAIAVAGDA